MLPPACFTKWESFISKIWFPTALQIPYMDYSRLANQLPSLKFPWTPLSGSRSVLSDSLRPHGLYNPWNSPEQNTGVGSLSLLQGIFPIQGSNPGLPHCRRIIYQLSHNRSPRILEWVAYPFSSRSSQPRNWTGVSCIAGLPGKSCVISKMTPQK